MRDMKMPSENHKFSEVFFESLFVYITTLERSILSVISSAEPSGSAPIYPQSSLSQENYIDVTNKACIANYLVTLSRGV